MLSAQTVIEEFIKLPREEQKVVLQVAQRKLYPNITLPNEIITQELRDARFTQGITCPHCQSKSVKRNGKVHGRQRYLCKACNKSFGDFTFTLLDGTHYPEKWLQYVECMVLGQSLRTIAFELKIHLSTAFYWRHKILMALSSVPSDALKGIVEADETYFLESLKGKNQVKKLGQRNPRKRGGVTKRRGISDEQVCVMVVADRQSTVRSKVVGNGRVSNDAIDKVLGDGLKEATCLCTDSGTNFVTYARTKAIEHHILNANKGQRVKRGIYHIQHAHSYRRRLKQWMERFQGVATKYLDNPTLEWFRYLELRKSLANRQKKQDMLIRAFVNSRHIPTSFLRTV